MRGGSPWDIRENTREKETRPLYVKMYFFQLSASSAAVPSGFKSYYVF